MRRAAPLLALAFLGAAPPSVLTVASARGERRVPVSTGRGVPAVALPALTSVLSLEQVTSPPGTLSLRVAGHAFAFVLDAGYFRFDERVYTLAAGPYVAGDTTFLPLQFLADALPRLLAARFRYDPARARLDELPAPAVAASAVTPVAPPPAASAAAPRRRRVVAIDPGHGGLDNGMSGPLGGGARFLKEKDVALAVARALAQELEARGVGAVLTRTRDTLISLGDRGRIAGRSGADLFISLHVNAANPRWRDAAAARGFETYYLAEARTEDARRVEQMENASVRFETSATMAGGDPVSFILRDLAQNEHLRESSRLAELVQGTLGEIHPAESRGVKQAGFMVLATSYMPAILIEMGFGTNGAEARYLTGAAGQRRLARAIADGVAAWIEEYERRVAGP